jgi:hypothetical protein
MQQQTKQRPGGSTGPDQPAWGAIRAVSETCRWRDQDKLTSRVATGPNLDAINAFVLACSTNVVETPLREARNKKRRASDWAEMVGCQSITSRLAQDAAAGRLPSPCDLNLQIKPLANERSSVQSGKGASVTQMNVLSGHVICSHY